MRRRLGRIPFLFRRPNSSSDLEAKEEKLEDGEKQTAIAPTACPLARWRLYQGQRLALQRQEALLELRAGCLSSAVAAAIPENRPLSFR